MFSLLLSTLAMMGLTFVIAFFVAGIIKIIANWADFLDFYHSHKEQILNLKKAHQAERQMLVTEVTAIPHKTHPGNKHSHLGHRINESLNGLKARRRVTA